MMRVEVEQDVTPRSWSRQSSSLLLWLYDSATQSCTTFDPCGDWRRHGSTAQRAYACPYLSEHHVGRQGHTWMEERLQAMHQYL